MKDKKVLAILLAIMAAIFYAINTPLSKILLAYVSPTFMASFLYLGAGVGVGIMYAFRFKKEDRKERLARSDHRYVIGMIVLDIIAPIFLLVGIKLGNASSASLLGNFEIVATAIIALFVFKERISSKLWIAIGLITSSSIILSIDSVNGFDISSGSLFVILATVCWGLENNCTRKISNKSTYEIVTLKGLCSGTGSFIIALIIGEKIPEVKYILLSMALGFVAYGLSIFCYVRAQRYLGAAKTSAFYALAPFIGAALAFAILGEQLTWQYFVALVIMIVGTILVVIDILVQSKNSLRDNINEHTT